MTSRLHSLCAGAALAVAAATVFSMDSAAQSAEVAKKVVIPPWVDDGALPLFSSEAFPEAASKAPTNDEWKDAPRVRLDKTDASECRAYRVREWIKLFCDRRVGGLRLIAGSSEGVTFWADEGIVGQPHEGFNGVARFGQLIFPVRRGDGRVIEVIEVGFGDWGDVGFESRLVIEEHWFEGDKSPQIAIIGL